MDTHRTTTARPSGGKKKERTRPNKYGNNTNTTNHNSPLFRTFFTLSVRKKSGQMASTHINHAEKRHYYCIIVPSYLQINLRTKPHLPSPFPYAHIYIMLEFIPGRGGGKARNEATNVVVVITGSTSTSARKKASGRSSAGAEPSRYRWE